MNVEMQLINHIIEKQDHTFLTENEVRSEMFRGTLPILEWVMEYHDRYGGYPTHLSVKEQFVEYEQYPMLDEVPYLVEGLYKQCVFQDLRDILISASQEASADPFKAMYEVSNSIKDLGDKYRRKVQAYDWVGEALSRYEAYMDTHGKDNLSELTFGIESLDEDTGGISENDLILLTARLGEGKSLLVSYFAYNAWLCRKIGRRKAIEQNLPEPENRPVIIISTEMNELDTSYRLDTLRGHFSNRALRRGALESTEDYKAYVEELKENKDSMLILTEKYNGNRPFTVGDIRQIMEKENPCFVLIDQIYDLDDGTGERDIRKRIVNISKQLEMLRDSMNIPVLMVAQAGRGASRDAKREIGATPELDQVQESDAPAQRATIALTVKSMLDKDIIKISLKKNRNGEKDIDYFLRADVDRGHYGEVSETTIDF